MKIMFFYREFLPSVLVSAGLALRIGGIKRFLTLSTGPGSEKSCPSRLYPEGSQAFEIT